METFAKLRYTEGDNNNKKYVLSKKTDDFKKKQKKILEIFIFLLVSWTRIKQINPFAAIF